MVMGQIQALPVKILFTFSRRTTAKKYRLFFSKNRLKMPYFSIALP